ncbi:Protein-glutamate methylesterase/protein-glutamine glutaminase [Streptomyces hirsutus]
MADQNHVLFVEDDDVIREATQLALERDGFAVTAMPDGLSGLEAFRADRPDIALLDVMVPGLDGVSLCRSIRDESMVPVIMLSARADAIDVVLGLEAGARRASLALAGPARRGLGTRTSRCRRATTSRRRAGTSAASRARPAPSWKRALAAPRWSPPPATAPGGPWPSPPGQRPPPAPPQRPRRPP